MLGLLRKYKYIILLWVLILSYTIYFSYFTILRYQTLYASYFDLGIMHQTVFNTFRAITNVDPGRILELTDPFGVTQIKRMVIHNDILLAFLAPFYLISSSPATLLVIQTVILALGALAVFKITQSVFEKNRFKNLYSLLFSLSYLLYPSLQRGNIFDFHAVTLASTLLLFMFYFWLKKRYWLSFLFLTLGIFSKEQVALTTAFFGLYILYSSSFANVIPNLFRNLLPRKQQVLNQVQDDRLGGSRLRANDKNFAFLIIGTSIVWFVLSVFVIIPSFRGGDHFALARYRDFGETPINVILGVFAKPQVVARYLINTNVAQYFLFLLGPLGFLSILAPWEFLIALPELGINLLSNNPNTINIIYHYQAVIIPFVFISAMYGVKRLASFGSPSFWGLRRYVGGQARMTFLVSYILFFSIIFAYLKGPLPFSREKEIHPFVYPQKEAKEAKIWAETLKNESLRISTTGQLSPLFTSRRYFYQFSKNYDLADYVALRLNEIYNYPEKDELILVYERLREDKDFQLIYKTENFEVYKKAQFKAL